MLRFLLVFRVYYSELGWGVVGRSDVHLLEGSLDCQGMWVHLSLLTGTLHSRDNHSDDRNLEDL